MFLLGTFEISVIVEMAKEQNQQQAIDLDITEGKKLLSIERRITFPISFISHYKSSEELDDLKISN